MATAIEAKIHPVDSSNIAGVGYHESSKTLIVRFKNGNLYHFLDVPRDEYDGFLEADSQGKYFHTHIRGAYKGVNMSATEGE